MTTAILIVSSRCSRQVTIGCVWNDSFWIAGQFGLVVVRIDGIFLFKIDNSQLPWLLHFSTFNPLLGWKKKGFYSILLLNTYWTDLCLVTFDNCVQLICFRRLEDKKSDRDSRQVIASCCYQQKIASISDINTPAHIILPNCVLCNCFLDRETKYRLIYERERSVLKKITSPELLL